MKAQSETAANKSKNEIAIFHYSTGTASLKNRITLKQNLFSFLLDGEKTVYYPGKQVKIIPGQFLLLSAGNCLMSEKTAGASGHYSSILVSFDNHLLADFFARYPHLVKPKSGQHRDEPFLVFERDAFLNHFLQSLSEMLKSGQPLSENMQRLKLEELLLYLSEQSPGQLAHLQTIGFDASDEILIQQAAAAGLEQPLTVEELAFLCHTSLSTFKRRFSGIYGISPNRWLLKKRMEKAALLLTQHHQKASEIYTEVGYENLSSFIQSFKQVYGVTPKQYQLSK